MAGITLASRALVALLLATCLHVSAEEIFVRRTEYPEGMSVEMSNRPFPGAVEEEVGGQPGGGLFPWSSGGPFNFLLGRTLPQDDDDGNSEGDFYPSPSGMFSFPSLFGGGLLRGLFPPTFWGDADALVRARDAPEFANVRAMNLGRMMAPGGMMMMGPGGMMMRPRGGMMMSAQPVQRPSFWEDVADEEEQPAEESQMVEVVASAGAVDDQGEYDASSGYSDDYESEEMEAFEEEAGKEEPMEQEEEEEQVEQVEEEEEQVEEQEAEDEEQEQAEAARREMRMVPQEGVPDARVFEGQAQVVDSNRAASLLDVMRPLEQVLQVVEELPDWFGGSREEGKSEPVQSAERPVPEGRPESMESAERPQLQLVEGDELAAFAEASPDMEVSRPAVDPLVASTQSGMNLQMAGVMMDVVDKEGMVRMMMEAERTGNAAKASEESQVAAAQPHESEGAAWKEEGLPEVVGELMEAVQEMFGDSQREQESVGELVMNQVLELEASNSASQQQQAQAQEAAQAEPQPVAIPDDRRSMMMSSMREQVPRMAKMMQQQVDRLVPKQGAAEAYAWEGKRHHMMMHRRGWDDVEDSSEGSLDSMSSSSSSSSDEGGLSRARTILRKMAHCPLLRALQAVLLVSVLAATSIYLLRRRAAAAAPTVTVVALCPDMENPLLHTYKTSEGHQMSPSDTINLEGYTDKEELVYQYRPPVLPDDKPLPGMTGN